MNPNDVRRAINPRGSFSDRFKNRWKQLASRTIAGVRNRFPLGKAKAFLAAKIDWRALGNDFALWLFEVSAEGTLVGFALWQIAGIDFRILRSLGMGVAVWWILDVVRRLRNGSTETVSKKSTTR